MGSRVRLFFAASMVVAFAGCQSCVEVSPHRYACDPTALTPDCPGGWHCGLEGFCRDPAETGNWRCALETDGGDCSPGWHCGLNDLRDRRECHSPTEPRAYACETDSDCEASWRCGLDQKCVNPTLDKLLPHSATLGPATVVSPKLFTRAPRLMAVSAIEAIGDPSNPVQRQSVVVMDGDRLVVVDRDMSSAVPIGANPVRINVIDNLPGVVGIATLGARTVQRADFADTAGDFQFHEGSFSYAVLQDGGFFEIQFPFDGGELPNDPGGGPFRHFEDADLFPVTFPATSLKVGGHNTDEVPALLVFDAIPQATGPNLLVSYGALSEAVSIVPFLSGVAGNRVVDATSLNLFGDQEFDTCVVVADHRGLWVTDVYKLYMSGFYGISGPWPLLVPGFDNAYCARPTTRDILGVNAGPPGYVVVRSRLKTPVGAPDEVALFDVTHWSRPFPGGPQGSIRACFTTSSAQCEPDPFDQPVTGALAFGPCAPCQSGEIVSFSVLPAVLGALPEIDVRCRDDADGGTREHSVHVRKGGSVIGGGCAVSAIGGTSSLFREPVTVAASIPSAVGFAGSAGQIWQGPSTATVSPLTFDRAPDALVRHGAGLPIVFAEGVIGWPVPELGIVSVASGDDDGRPVAAVAARQDLVVLRNGAVVSLAVPSMAGYRMLVPAIVSGALASPNTAALASRRGQGAEVLVGSGDTLFASDISLNDRGSPLESKLVPLAGSAILSIAPIPPLADGPLIEAFVLTRGGVLKVRADSDVSWSAVRIPLPVGPVPVAIWAEGRAGRVGFDDGTIFSLDSVVPLSKPLPASRASDYAVLCGQPYALGGKGLFRLELKAGEVLASWAVVPTAGAPLPVAATRIFPFSEANGTASLFVFDNDGRTVALPVAPCAP